MSKSFVYLLSLLTWLIACDTKAEHSPWTTNIYFENDLFGETDQNYTNGIRISWISPDTKAYFEETSLPPWVRAVNNKLSYFNPPGEKIDRNMVISLAQLMYTPSDINATELLGDQRPYAGYLYLGFGYHTRSNKQLDTIEFDIGIVGPAAQGEEAQDFIHDLRDFDKFQGWDNQLRNEPAFTFVYEHKRKMLPKRLIALDSLEHDFIGHAGVSLGNVATYLNFGGEYRVGWALPDDFGTAAVRPGGDNSAPGGGAHNKNNGALLHGFHVFVSMDARLIAQDIFLDGNSFRNSHGVSKEKEVADFSSGFSFLTGKWKVSFAWVVRTREFKQQPHHHKYGSLSLSYSP